jgi:hypothetical protein
MTTTTTTESGYTTISAECDSEILLSLARGCYQRNLLRGSCESWSGSTLRGLARTYSGRYAQSRAALVERIQRAGYAIRWLTGERGRRVLSIHVPAELAAA